MILFSIFLQISLLFATPDSLPNTDLQDLSNSHVAVLFSQANDKIKDKEVISLLEETCQSLNGQVLVARGEDIIFSRSVGFKKLYKNIPNLKQRNAALYAKSNQINDSTMIELASVSKQFTAAAVLKLASQKRLDTNDLVVKYFPKFPYPTITIRHLLMHTSGLPDYIDFKDHEFRNRANFSNMELLNHFASTRPKLLFKPSTQFKYCNSNYAILAAIVEKVTNQSFSIYVKDNILTPAKMTHSCFVNRLNSCKPINYAFGHLASQSEVPPHFTNNALGDKGLYSTAYDLYNWAKVYLINDSILPKGWLALAVTPHVKCKANDDTQYYGFGYRLEDSRDFGFQVYHGGLWRGFNNIFLYRPEDQIVIIFLSNFRNRAHAGKANQIFSILDGV